MKTFETDSYRMAVHDDYFVEFVVKGDILFNAEHLRESKEMLLMNYPGKKFFVLFVGEEFFQVTKEARELAASKEFSSHLAAVALHTKNFSLRLLGDLYMKINKPNAPTKFFSDREAAIEWLREKMKAEPYEKI
jgi:hypothetical protein